MIGLFPFKSYLVAIGDISPIYLKISDFSIFSVNYIGAPITRNSDANTKVVFDF